jgi:hypothetical protein
VRHEIVPASRTEGVFLRFGRLLSRGLANDCAKHTQGHRDLQHGAAARAGDISLHSAYSLVKPEWPTVLLVTDQGAMSLRSNTTIILSEIQ